MHVKVNNFISITLDQCVNTIETLHWVGGGCGALLSWVCCAQFPSFLSSVHSLSCLSTTERCNSAAFACSAQYSLQLVIHRVAVNPNLQDFPADKWCHRCILVCPKEKNISSEEKKIKERKCFHLKRGKPDRFMFPKSLPCYSKLGMRWIHFI